MALCDFCLFQSTVQKKVVRSQRIVAASLSAMLVAMIITTIIPAFKSAAASGAFLESIQGPMPPGWEDGSVTLQFKVDYYNATSDKNYASIHFALDDKDKSGIIEAVTYSVRLSEDIQGLNAVIADVFYSPEGPLTLILYHDESIKSTQIVAGREPFLGRWVTNDDDNSVTVRTPVNIQDKPYYLHLEILGAESQRDLFPVDEIQALDFYLEGDDMMENIVVPEFPFYGILVVPAAFLGCIVAIGRTGFIKNFRQVSNN